MKALISMLFIIQLVKMDWILYESGFLEGNYSITKVWESGYGVDGQINNNSTMEGSLIVLDFKHLSIHKAFKNLPTYY